MRAKTERNLRLCGALLLLTACGRDPLPPPPLFCSWRSDTLPTPSGQVGAIVLVRQCIPYQ